MAINSVFAFYINTNKPEIRSFLYGERSMIMPQLILIEHGRIAHAGNGTFSDPISQDQLARDRRDDGKDTLLIFELHLLQMLGKSNEKLHPCSLPLPVHFLEKINFIHL